MAKKSLKKPKQLSVFISYASEDRELAAAFEAELLQLFAVTPTLSPIKVFRDVGISKGVDYRAAINSALSAADVLLVVLTDRLKPSFAYPGFEVGFFTKSLEERPKIFGEADRKILPVCIGAENPATLEYLQAIEVKEDHICKISHLAPEAADAALPGGVDNPVFSLLANISDTIVDVLGDHHAGGGGFSKADETWRTKLLASAARLYSSIRAYLEGRISSETYPERKVVVHTDTPPVIGDQGVDLSKAKIELFGSSFQVFGFPEGEIREFDWAGFLKKMPAEMSGTWGEGIRTLVTNSLQGSDENYHVVASSKGNDAYRLFVARIVTYVSKRTEIHIYIVKMVLRHYGDPLTSRLLSAINVGLQFRFMFLEERSEFRPAKFEYPMMVDASKEMEAWKSSVAELLGHMNLILREAQDQHLMDPDLLDKIWGLGGGERVQQMMTTWENARVKLYSAAEDILTSTEKEFPSRQEPFRKALRELYEKTEVMNREYTLRALRAVAEEVGPAPAQVPGPGPAVAANGSQPQPATLSKPVALP
jgi:hypothetical protein